MMKKYNVTVNGTVYEVMVEEVAGGASAAPAPVATPAPAPVAAAPAPAPKAAPVAPAPAAAPAGACSITAPMPGTILALNVSVGQSVKKGDAVCVLEALKMENDIPAPQDGVVVSVEAFAGARVETDQVVVTID